MALASPVWAKFFFPPFGWSEQQIEQNLPVDDVDFSEDNQVALLILLNILHLNLRRFQKTSPCSSSGTSLFSATNTIALTCRAVAKTVARISQIPKFARFLGVLERRVVTYQLVFDQPHIFEKIAAIICEILTSPKSISAFGPEQSLL